ALFSDPIISPISPTSPLFSYTTLFRSADTPIFEKYIIDFSVMKENGVLSEIPGNAFENGGIYQYGLITPEENPRVKLIDLRVTRSEEHTSELQSRFDLVCRLLLEK